MVFKMDDTKQVELLFDHWQETLIWSCMQKVMGTVYADSLDCPQSAMAIIGDFCFLAGQAKEKLVLYKPQDCTQNFIIMVPQNDEWSVLIENSYGTKAKKVTRYAIKKEPDVFDRENLENAVHALPSQYSLTMLEEDIFDLCKSNDWSRDLVSQYKDYETYKKLGLGVVVLKDGEIVSGASSYTRYQEGIEIEIETKVGHRRKGLAYVCAAKLILECLNRNLYPSWDAQNKWSVALAEKLGYHFDHEYIAYEICKY